MAYLVEVGEKMGGKSVWEGQEFSGSKPSDMFRTRCGQSDEKVMFGVSM